MDSHLFLFVNIDVYIYIYNIYIYTPICIWNLCIYIYTHTICMYIYILICITIPVPTCSFTSRVCNIHILCYIIYYTTCHTCWQTSGEHSVPHCKDIRQVGWSYLIFTTWCLQNSQNLVLSGSFKMVPGQSKWCHILNANHSVLMSNREDSFCGKPDQKQGDFHPPAAIHRTWGSFTSLRLGGLQIIHGIFEKGNGKLMALREGSLTPLVMMLLYR